MNEGEELLALHLAELGVAFTRQCAYAVGRKMRADFGLPAERILIEVQGGIYSKQKQGHSSISGILADLARLNLATINNWRMMRFTPDQIASGEAKLTIVLAIEKGETA